MWFTVKEREMKIDSSKIYMTPFLRGPVYDRNALPKIQYTHTETIAIQFRTDYESAGKLIPDCYEVDKNPLATIVFTYNNGLDFMAGGGYNLATFWVSAMFHGERDQVAGDYILVMFENHTRPILGGREYLGVPKMQAEIPPIKIMPDGGLRCEASYWGHFIFGIELPVLKRQNALVRSVVSKRINNRPWLAYKYVPSLDGPPDADYPAMTCNDIHIKTLWMGKKGSICFGSASEKDISDTAYVISALKTLPMQKIEQVLHFKGSAVLRLDLSHRLI
jgi:acetoacetate decarboxylase